jgi:hypothetical protein
MDENGIGWLHPKDFADQWDGFNEPGVEHFSGQPIQHLAREIVQNSLDAADDGLVEVRFKNILVKTSEVPDVDSLRENLLLCRTAAVGESKKAQSFFDEAINILSQEKISVLQVSDHSTKGMAGPSENGKPFYAFMKAKGQSKKSDDTATGSFGIGKFAPYAVSKLRSIFVSTVYQDENGEFQQLTQGKSILMSHDKNGERRQGVGFWGRRSKCQPVTGVCDDVAKWIKRSQSVAAFGASKGSTLNILGFDAIHNWQIHLAVSVAENFFGAIFDGRLRVVVGERFALDKTTIVDFFSDDSVRELISKLDNEPECFDNCRAYLAAHSGGVEVIEEESEQLHLGLCQVKIIVAEGLPRKVCVLRNGMFITDSLAGLRRFSDFKDFVAVFHCQSTKGNELLRAMEPPRHDDFEPARLFGKEEQKKGKKALADLATWIKDALRQHAKDPVHDVTSLDELKDLFGDEGDGEGGKGLEEVNPYGSVIIRAKAIRPKDGLSGVGLSADGDGGEGSATGDDEGEGEGGGGKEGAGGGDGKGGTGAAEGDGSGGGGGGGAASTNKSPVDISNVRAIVLGDTSRRIAFTPFSTGTVLVELREAGADSDYPLAITSAQNGTIRGDGVELRVVAGQRVVLNVGLAESFNGAVKVIANEVR